MKKSFIIVAALVAVVFAAYSGFTTMDSVAAPAPTAAAKTYSATIYVAYRAISMFGGLLPPGGA